MNNNYRTRPEIWRLAKWLQAKLSKASGWVAADQAGWYDFALETHNEVYRQASPYLKHDIPIECQVQIAEKKALS